MNNGNFKNRAADIKGKLLKNKFVLIVIAVGLIFILLPTGGGAGSVPEPRAAEITDFSLKEQERKIAEALSKIDGAGSVSVVLTLKTGGEQVLATDSEGSSKYAKGENGENTVQERETTVIISAGSQTENPVTVKYIYPEFKGALVVAEGAGDANVRLELMQAVAGLTGLKSDKITVSKMKKS